MSAAALTDWQSRLPASVDPQAARLPINYEAAKHQLAKCLEIDEVKSWADRSAALASYAKQASDQSLRVMAQRIHLRAVARIGELLLQIPPSHGGKMSLVHSRKHVARAVGLSGHETNRALAIARIPQQELDAAIESEAPPSAAALEERAPPSPNAPRHSLVVGGSKFYRLLSRRTNSLFAFCNWTKRRPMPAAFGELNNEERQRVLHRIAEARQWLDGLERACQGAKT